MYPPGVVTRTCTVGGSAAVESGTDLVISVSIEASRGLIRAGERMPSSPEVKTSIAGGEVSFDLPVSDQSGYRDEATGAIIDVSAPGSHTHTYTATITTTRGTKLVSQRIVTFPLPTGDLSPVDVDTLVDAGTVAGVLVSVPDVWSAQVAQAVAAAGSASAAAGSASAAAGSAADAEAARAAAEALADITVTTGAVVGNDLILTRTDATIVNAGNVRGATGPANTLTIGTVTTLAAGSSATAAITGTAPTQTLALGLPNGQPSDWLKVGPGDPRTPASTGGVIAGTEANGCMYRSTDGGGVGGYLWTKRAGVWVCETGDTGWRTLVAWDSSGVITAGAFASASWGPKTGQAGSIRVRRNGQRVIWRFLWPTVAATGQGAMVTIPTGFGDAGAGSPASAVTSSAFKPWILQLHGPVVFRILGDHAVGDSLGHFHSQEVDTVVDAAWPTTLP